MQEEGESEIQPKEPIIYLHALEGILAPKTLKLPGYIKHRKGSFGW